MRVGQGAAAILPGDHGEVGGAGEGGPALSLTRVQLQDARHSAALGEAGEEEWDNLGGRTDGTESCLVHAGVCTGHTRNCRHVTEEVVDFVVATEQKVADQDGQRQ